MTDMSWLDPNTVVLHSDRDVDDAPGVGPPIHAATTYDRSDQEALVYRRSEHPTTDRLEAVLGSLEGGHAVVLPSGMAAAALILRQLRPKRLALPMDLYHGIGAIAADEESHGTLELVPPEALEEGDVWWIETPSNPRLQITEIAAVAREASQRGVVTVVDSTFGTPVLQKPLALGADVVMHSSTKFIGGHSDAMGGVVVVGDPGLAETLRYRRMVDGATPGSLDVWLSLRGVRTLPLRVHRQAATALEVARYLEGKVPMVWYPGLASHPGHAVAQLQMRAFGAILSMELADAEAAETAVKRLRLFRQATSLGGVESLAEWRRSVNPAAPEGLIRLSIGLEAPQDLIGDLAQALDIEPATLE